MLYGTIHPRVWPTIPTVVIITVPIVCCIHRGLLKKRARMRASAVIAEARRSIHSERAHPTSKHVLPLPFNSLGLRRYDLLAEFVRDSLDPRHPKE